MHDDAHRRFIAGLPCVVCGDNTATEAAHVRYADPSIGKRHVGLGEKADDRWCVPLCNKHHREQHNENEEEWWKSKFIDPIWLARLLYKFSGEHDAGEFIVWMFCKSDNVGDVFR